MFLHMNLLHNKSFKVTQSLPYKLILYDRLAQKKWLLQKAIYLFSHILISMDVFSSNFGKIVPPGL